MKPCRLLATALLLTVNLPGAETMLAVRVTHGDLPVADAVVSLAPLDAPAPLRATAEAVVAQEDKEFDPYVTPVLVGTRVTFPNRDTVQHHIYSLSKPKRFEKPLYASGASETVLFDQPGVVALGCNIHDWMVAYVVVLPTPWFAKTGAEGSARLAGLPPGRYRLEVWHPRLARPVQREITLGTGGPAAETVALTLKADRRIRRAPETRTGAY
jgi:plastocyanin